MREGMGQQGQRLMTATEKVWKVRQGRNNQLGRDEIISQVGTK